LRKPRTDIESFLSLEPESEEAGKPLHEYVGALLGKLALLWKHRRLVSAVSLGGLAIAICISLLLPVKFVATAFLMPPDMNPISGLDMMIDMKSGGALMGAMGGELNDVLGMRSPGQLYIREMQTRPVEDDLIKRFDLFRVYHGKTLEGVRKVLEANSAFDEDRKSGIISVQITDKDPTRAAALANGYAEELGRLQADINSDAGRREREYFGGQLLAAHEQLEQSSKALSDFTGRNAALNLPLQDAAVVTSMSEVQGQLIAAQAELKGLLPIYAEDSLRVREARAQISELEHQLDQIKGQTAPSGKPPLSDAGKDTANGNGPASRMKQLSGLTTEYMELYGKAKTDEAMVETLTQQYQIAKLEESRHVAEVQLVDPAQVPERKTYPKRRWIALEGLLLGFFFATFFVLVRDWWHNTSDDNEWKRMLRPFVEKGHSQETDRTLSRESGLPTDAEELEPQPTRSKF